jgi:putative ABC transport system permease protein
LALRQGLAPVLAGLAAGLTSTLFCGRLLKGFLFGVNSFDPLTISCVASVALVVALAACNIPARRATLLDPMVALRYE